MNLAYFLALLHEIVPSAQLRHCHFVKIWELLLPSTLTVTHCFCFAILIITFKLPHISWQ